MQVSQIEEACARIEKEIAGLGLKLGPVALGEYGSIDIVESDLVVRRCITRLQHAQTKLEREIRARAKARSGSDLLSDGT